MRITKITQYGEQMRYRKRLPAYERMMQRVKIPEDKNGCWLWCGPVNNAGYGMIRGNDGYPKMTTVHRIAGQHKGLDIRRKEVQHTCLTKNCVNPDHLVIGTPKSRCERIMKKHGRHFAKPKQAYKKCKHCGDTTHVTWFKRMHSECYTDMKSVSINKNKV